ncbi:hypothetical protein FM789_08685, partial [Francisella tularensis]|uniref:hypothetical protein n=1 Tax=Francisella tularensis TaxID=263 RepID=UPI00135D7969
LPTYLASSNSYPNINNNLKINHKKTNFTIQAQNETHGGFICIMSSLYFLIIVFKTIFKIINNHKILAKDCIANHN